MGRVKEAVGSWPPVSNTQSAKQISVIDLENELLESELNTNLTTSALMDYSPQQHPIPIAQPLSMSGQGSTYPVYGEHPLTHVTPNSVRAVQTGYYPLSPLGSGGFIFNYPPMYSLSPLPPFSQPLNIGLNTPSMHHPQPTPLSPTSSSSSSSSSPLSSGPSSPVSSCPLSPSSSSFSLVESSLARKEKLEKYRQKRTKRNWNRPVDQARRERAQARVRDEFGHFVSAPTRRSSSSSSSTSPLDEEKERMKIQMDLVFNQMEAMRRESEELKNKLGMIEQELQEQHKINTELVHENRVLWGTVPTTDVFSTIRPGNPIADAFKERIDFSSIELNWTDSPYFDQLSRDDLLEIRKFTDPVILETAGSLS